MKIRKRNNNTELELLEQRQQKLLESIRRKTMQEIASDDGSGTLEEQMKAINAGYRILWSYGFEGNELQKSWKCCEGSNINVVEKNDYDDDDSDRKRPSFNLIKSSDVHRKISDFRDLIREILKKP